jgi:protein-S-isoprenylcysteine O-methyltransferase Ste14
MAREETERMLEKLRIHMTWVFAFLLAVVILFSSSIWEVRFPLLSSLLFLVGIFLVATGSIGRLWCSLYIGGYKTEKLITVGPYSMCRNPLYFFSLFGATGAGLASENLTVPLIILCGFCLYYPFVILSEQEHLRSIHGKEYDTYLRVTPAFFPKPSLMREPAEYVVKPHVFRRRMLGALYFVWLVGLLELIEEAHELNLLPIFFWLY